MTDLRKTILITGCSPGGIGNELARAFHASGLRVFATARKASTIADLSDLGIETFSLTVDNPVIVRECFTEIEQLVGSRGLDYLFNNAGRNYTVPALEIQQAELLATFNTNLFAIIDINAVFAPLLLAAKGTFIHTGSVAALMPYVWGAAYNASKAALHSYCNTLRVEMAPFGVGVLVVVAGGVKSQIARTDRTLPDTSLFKSIESDYIRRTKHSQEAGIPADIFARGVVRQVLTARGWLWDRTTIWGGGASTLIWVAESVDWWFPGGVYGFGMRRMFGLNKLDGTEGKKLL